MDFAFLLVSITRVDCLEWLRPTEGGKDSVVVNPSFIQSTAFAFASELVRLGSQIPPAFTQFEPSKPTEGLPKRRYLSFCICWLPSTEQ